MSEGQIDPVDSAIAHREAIASVMAGGASQLGGANPNSARETPHGPMVLAGTQKGRKFKAFLMFENPGDSIQASNARVETVTMLELSPDRVLVRTEASQVCYSIVGQIVNQNSSVHKNGPPTILGHSAVGIVEAIGENIRRVAVGDRVMLANSPQCGVCYNCLRNRSDRCLNSGFEDPQIIGTLSDGRGVVQQHDRGGLAELIITPEQYCIPIFDDVSPRELAMLGCPGAAGLGCTTGFVAPVSMGADVAVIGCGPLGLSAIQGARIKGASQIIAVEPIAARRTLARQFGATTVIDPNIDTAHVVERIRDLCKGPSTRTWAGGKAPEAASPFQRPGASGSRWGPDFVVEAVGGDFFPPKAEIGPDPTGLLSLRWAWDLCAPAGHVSTVSVAQRGNFCVPAREWSNGPKNHHPGNFNGVATLKDMQIYARLIARGQFDAKSMATSTFPLERTKEALQMVSDRTTAGAVLVFG